MIKPETRTYSRYTREASALLGKLIRLARIEKKLTATELAERAGISRGLLARIEKGDLKCEIGATFEVATLVGVTLFGDSSGSLAQHSKRADDTLALLPKYARPKTQSVNDDF